MIERYYTENRGPVKENEMIAFQKAVELSKSIENINEITILIHTKNNTGYIERTIGADYLKGLFKGTVVAYENGPKVKIETIRTYEKLNFFSNKRRVLLAFGLDSEDLFKYDANDSVQAVVAHQWRESGVADWAKAWGATELISGRKAESGIDLDNVIKEALTDLTESINLSTGISHSMDNSLCKTYLRALNKYGYDLEAVKISSFLVAELGWDYDSAKDVIALVGKLNSGSYFRGGEKTGLQNHIKRWKTRK